MNWFFAGFALALLLWFFALLYLKSFVRQRTSPDHILALLQEEVRQLEADIDEKTEQDLQLLEDKIVALREICAEADRRVAVLSRELRLRAFGLSVSPVPAAPPSAAVASSATPVAPSTPSAETPIVVTLGKPVPAEGANSPGRASPVRGGSAPPSGAPALSQAGPKIIAAPIPIKGPPLKDRIAELYRAGFAPEMIAERLGVNVGEVNLYITMTKLPGGA